MSLTQKSTTSGGAPALGSLRKGLFVELRQCESGQWSFNKESPAIRLHHSRPPDVWDIIPLVSLSPYTDLGCAAFLVFALAVLGSALDGASRRAILVGIDNYNPDATTQAQLLRDLKPPAVKRPVVEGDAKYWRFDDLDGAVNDVRLMKAVLQSLGFQDFVVLTDRDATADAILQALQKNLVDDAQPGDLRLFYYSGHGNHVKNRASAEQQQEDQTLVPADNWRNVPDIRDKEISRILFHAARKSVIVTMIADSCHSGSLARGVWNSGGKARTNSGTRAGTPGVTLHEPVANDPPDRDPATHQPIDPEMLGVLTLAAAQPNQEAREVQTEDGPHGAFTWALAQSLRFASEPMDRIFARTMAALGANGAIQQPVMGGPSRFSQTILGQPPAAGGGISVVVDSVKGADIHLRAAPPSVSSPGAASRLSASLPSPSRSLPPTASTVPSRASSAKAASSRETYWRWSVGWFPPKPACEFRFPNRPPRPWWSALPPSSENCAATPPSTGSTTPPPAHLPTSSVGTGRPGFSKPIPPPSPPVWERSRPPPISNACSHPKRACWCALPPTTSLLPAIPLGDPDHSAVEISTAPAGAQYWFWGKISDSGPAYAWLLPDSTEASVRDAAGQIKRASGYLPLPIRSDWVKLREGSEGVRAAAPS